MYKVVIFEKTVGVCFPCKMTKEVFKYHTGEIELRAIEDLEQIELEAFKMRGMLSAPIVQIVAENGVVLDEWAGFRSNKIKEYVKGEL